MAHPYAFAQDDTVDSVVIYCHVWLHQCGNHLEVDTWEQERPGIEPRASGFETDCSTIVPSHLLCFCVCSKEKTIRNLWHGMQPLFKTLYTMEIVWINRKLNHLNFNYFHVYLTKQVKFNRFYSKWNVFWFQGIRIGKQNDPSPVPLYLWHRLTVFVW